MEEKKIEETVNHLTEMKKDRKKQKRKMPKEVSQNKLTTDMYITYTNQVMTNTSYCLLMEISAKV